jgi:hypothetical protein
MQLSRPLTHRRPVRGLIAIGAASAIVIGFFLPWVEGASLLDFRSFSGFDLARLVRNFEISVGPDSELNELRASAIALYIVPALAVNAAALELLRWRLPDAATLSRAASVACGAYAAFVLLVVLLLSQVPVNNFEVVAGTPSWGFAMVAVGAALLVWTGAFARSRRDL